MRSGCRRRPGWSRLQKAYKPPECCDFRSVWYPVWYHGHTAALPSGLRRSRSGNRNDYRGPDGDGRHSTSARAVRSAPDSPPSDRRGAGPGAGAAPSRTARAGRDRAGHLASARARLEGRDSRGDRRAARCQRGRACPRDAGSGPPRARASRPGDHPSFRRRGTASTSARRGSPRAPVRLRGWRRTPPLGAPHRGPVAQWARSGPIGRTGKHARSASRRGETHGRARRWRTLPT